MREKYARYLLALGCIALAGCSTGGGLFGGPRVATWPRRVEVVSPERAQALAQVYLVIERASSGPAADLDVEPLAGRVRRTVEQCGGRLVAWQVLPAGRPGTTGGAAHRAARLNPSSLLHIHLAHASLKESEQEEERGDGAARRKFKVYASEAQTRLPWRWTAWPSQELLAQGTEQRQDSRQTEETRPAERQREAAGRMGSLFDQAASALAKRLSPVTVVYHDRYFQQTPGDPESEQAYQHARRGRWAEAETLWQTRIERSSESWKDAFNLAIAHERRKDDAAARRYYELARRKAAGAAEADRIPWDEIFGDLSAPAARPAAPDGGSRWFGQKIAVLPFSDESTSIDGPIHARALAQAALARSGYAVMDLAEVDRRLREHGFTQGGQLKAVTPEQLAGWLKADLLLFGHLDRFNEVMLGIYGQRRVSGTLRLWSAAERSDVLQNRREVMTSSTPPSAKGKDIGLAFLGQLGKAWVERASKKPLDAELQRFIRQALEDWPRRPL